ncbi:MAG: hypothetical protein ABI193_20950 [Minicystis sp.]
MTPPSPVDQPLHDALFATRALGQAPHDPRALRILAKTIYRELRQSGLEEKDVMTVAGELLSLLAVEVKDRRLVAEGRGSELPSRSAPR